MENLKFNLTLEESNLILKALGDMPYVQVASLIQTIRQQAESQLQQTTPDTEVPAKEINQNKGAKDKQKMNGKAELV